MQEETKNYIYFSFHIEHDKMPSMVKIGGTKNWNNRIDQHLSSHLAYFVVCETDKDFKAIEQDIKIRYYDKRIKREHYKYHYGMLRDIINEFKLNLECVVAPLLEKEYDFIYDYMEFKEPLLMDRKLRDSKSEPEVKELRSYASVQPITYEQRVEIESMQSKGEVNNESKIQLDKYYHDEIVEVKEIVNVPETYTESQCEELVVKVKDKVFDSFRKKNLLPLIDHKMLRNDPSRFIGKVKRLGERHMGSISDRWSNTLTMDKLSVKLGLKHIYDIETVIKREDILKSDTKELIMTMSKIFNYTLPTDDKGWIGNLRAIIRKHTKIMSLEGIDHHMKKFKLKHKESILQHVDLWEVIK